MKHLKAMTAALALMVAGSANAAIINGQTNTVSDPKNGELFVSIVDANANLSYHMDLGVRFLDFIANPNIGTIDLSTDANFQTFLANGANPANFKFNVAAANNSWNTTDVNQFGQSGVIISSNSGQAAVEGSLLAFNNIAANTQKIGIYADELNAASGAPLALDESNGGANLSAISTNPNAPVGSFPTLGYHGKGNWGSNMGNGVTFNTEGVVDSALAIYFSHVSTTDFNSGIADFLTDVTLSSNGQLAFGGSVPQVPVPAAVWLMGSGLVGLFSVGRRKSSKA